MPQPSAAGVPWLVRTLGLFCLLAAAGCSRTTHTQPSAEDVARSLPEARRGFETRIVQPHVANVPVEEPPPT